MSVCLQSGSHPSRLKPPNGSAPPKPGKAGHTTPRFFRVVLLDTFSKILEKIFQSRLSATTHPKDLVFTHQAGSPPGASAEGAASRLTRVHDIYATHRPGLYAITGFSDIIEAPVMPPPNPPRPPKLTWHSVLLRLLAQIPSLKSVHHPCLPRCPEPFRPSLSGGPTGSAVSPHFSVIYVVPTTRPRCYFASPVIR